MRRLLGLFIVTLMSATVFAGSTTLFLKAGRIDTSAKAMAQIKARVGSNPYYVVQYPASEMRLYIVQFNRSIDSSIKDLLSRHDMKIADYIPDNAFVVWTTGSQMNALQDSSIQWKGIYQPAFRIDTKLKNSKAATVKVQVSLYSFVDPRICRFELADMGAAVEKSGVSGWQSTFLATVPVGALPQLTRIPGLKWVEAYVAPQLHSMMVDVPVKGGGHGAKNEASRNIMNVDAMWNAGYTGASQIAAVCDTGLDVGNMDSIHLDFYKDTNSDGHNDKILAAYALGRTNDWSDTNGHGTHTAGSVVGNGTKSNGRFRGMAYEARLVEQSVLDSRGSLGGLPSDLNTLFQQAYDDGARVHSNSWGAPVAGQYDTSAVQVDQFAWNHKDMVITFSAGNDGVDSNRDGVVDLDSMGSPGTAKNCITVGASESNVNQNVGYWGTWWPTSYPTEPIKSDNVCDNADGMSAFSSRGPCDDSRIKPDIVAPGSNIISVRSQDSSAGTGWGVYDSWYLYEGGTSMSNPLTAGAAVVVREFFIQHEGITPSSALIKASMMNGAYDMYPGQYGTGSTREQPSTRPNNVEGWGRVDLGNAFLPSAPVQMKYADEGTGLNTNGTKTYSWDVSDGSVPMHVTLAWTDYPASTSSSKQLVNDLDLTVQSPTGTTYYPNHLSSADHTNNVETVDIASPVTGTYTITVKGYNVPQGAQPFALVAHAGFGTSAPDTTPPVITGISVNPSFDSATVTWTTDEAATSTVEYGTSSSLGLTATPGGYATSHSVTLSGLNAETTYYYRVRSKDSSNNESVSGTSTFTTTAEPVTPTSFSDDMESGSSKWTTAAQGSSPWVIVSTSYVHSGSHSWFSADEPSVKDDMLMTQEIDLRSASTGTLTFWHTYYLENTYDGAVVEISTDGGNTFTDLGSHITTGGYTGTISTSYSSPIGGRSAWTGGSLGTMTQVSVDLGSFTGNKVIVRFRMACDSSVNKTGWYVDDVTITASGTTPAPTIDSFSASPSTITNGGSSTLSWTTTNATSCTINGSSVAVDGSTTVSPTTTTTYTLTATGSGGSVSQNVTVTVNAAAPTIDSFGASPSTITSGGSSTLSWTTTNATSCTINGSSVAVDGSMTVSPTTTTTYTLTATGSGGSVSQNVTVTVNAVTPPPTIDSFGASPSTIDEGSSATLSWTTSNATSCTINGSSVAVDGSMTVSPTTTTTYTLSATGDGGNVSQNVIVTVNPASGTVETRTFSSGDVPKSIPDNNSTGVTSTLVLNDGHSIQDFQVTVNITHTYIGDLVVSLISPSGTEVILSNRAGGSADNINQTYTLTNFNGLDAVGTWTLKVKDLARYDTGTIDSWSLAIKATYSSSTHDFPSTDTPISIPDNNTTGITSTLNVSASATVTSFAVTVNITHTYIGDLVVTLYAPNGSTTVLSNREGGSANNINKTWTVTASSGLAIHGDWKLKVTDGAGVDVGTLDNWKLSFSY